MEAAQQRFDFECRKARVRSVAGGRAADEQPDARPEQVEAPLELARARIGPHDAPLERGADELLLLLLLLLPVLP